jgi:hypothetical protein
MNEELSMLDPKNQTRENELYYSEIGKYFQHSCGDVLARLRDFPKFIPRQTLASFLAKHEIFKETLNVHGHIIECGVFMGGGLMSWAQLSAIYEPYNHVRQIIGFDTFAGFPSFAKQDKTEEGAEVDYAKVSGLAVAGIEADIKRAIELYDLNRPIGHISKIELVKGDATETIPRYVEENKHLVVALLYLDFDLYEPTLAALKAFLPRMPKGAVVAFDELNQKQWPGETLAVLDSIGIRNLRIQRFPFTPQISYAILD